MINRLTMHATILVGTVVATCFITGCHSTSKTAAKMQAEARWNQVRSNIKLQLAQRKFKGGLFDESLDSATEAVSLNPNEPAAYVLLAKAHLELGQPASAERALLAAQQANLDSAELAYMQGVLHEQRGKLKLALANYTRALDMNPSYVEAVVANAECLAELDQPEKALVSIDQHINQVDEKEVLMTLAVHLAVLTNDADIALARLHDAISQDANVLLVSPNVAGLLMRSKRYEEAALVLEPVVADTDKDYAIPHARRMLATCYLESNDPVLAVDVLRAYAQAKPADISAQLILAKAAILKGEYFTAQDAVNRVQAKQPNLPESYFLSAVINWQRGLTTAAQESLNRLLTLEPNNVDGHCLMGQLLESQGLPTLARQHFEQALALEPSCTWAKHALDKIS